MRRTHVPRRGPPTSPGEAEIFFCAAATAMIRDQFQTPQGTVTTPIFLPFIRMFDLGKIRLL